MKLAVLMFHALYQGQAGLDRLRPEERPYAIECADFRSLLLKLKALQPRWIAKSTQWDAEGSGTQIMLSFDDGHRSALELAAPLMRDLDIPGVFFVTSDFVRERQDYLSQAELREMVSLGMQVQSHGQTHRFLNTLDPTEAATEFADSKNFIEQGTGQAVDAISFPGGRFGKRELALGEAAGYRDFYTSKFGRNGAAEHGTRTYRRLAFRRGMPDRLIVDLVQGKPWPTYRTSAIAAVKSGVRSMLGESGYDALYRMTKGRG